VWVRKDKDGKHVAIGRTRIVPSSWLYGGKK
jgi:hypothetical protein